MTLDLDQLRALYFDGTKHAVYQRLPDFVAEELGVDMPVDETWRGVSARYRNLLDTLDFGRIGSVGDVGANTGFFSLSLAHRFPGTKFIAYEVNPDFCTFINIVSEHFRLGNLETRELLIDLSGLGRLEFHDVLLAFNVLHHAGVDFDCGAVDLPAFASYARRFLAGLRARCRVLVFQMGFNWGGDKKHPIVSLDDDAGKVVYVASAVRESGWEIDSVYAVCREGVYDCIPLPHELVRKLNAEPASARSSLTEYVSGCRMATFSEFYRRPIFYCNNPEAR